MSNTNVSIVDPNRGNTTYTFQEALPVQLAGGGNTGGALPYSYVSQGTNSDAMVVSNTQTTLFSELCVNLQNTVGYLKIYDKATAPANTDTPKLRIPVPCTSGNTGGGEAFPFPPQGVVFTNGLAFRMTGGIADNDNTNVSANALVLNLVYQN
jgi:hypothetical protein